MRSHGEATPPIRMNDKFLITCGRISFICFRKASSWELISKIKLLKFNIDTFVHIIIFLIIYFYIKRERMMICCLFQQKLFICREYLQPTSFLTSSANPSVCPSRSWYTPYHWSCFLPDFISDNCHHRPKRNFQIVNFSENKNKPFDRSMEV